LDKNTRRELIARLHSLRKRDREELFARAEALRTQRALTAAKTPPPKAAGRNRARVTEEEEAAAIPRKMPSVEDVALELLARDPQHSPNLLTGTVLTVRRGRVIASVKGEPTKLPLSDDLTSRQQTEVAVGDQVVIVENRVEAVLPRRSELSRDDVHAKIRRVIVANVDLVVHVVSVISPPLHPRIIDRIRLAAATGKCGYAIAVNKTDLPGADEELMRLDPYRDSGVPICLVSAHGGQGIDELTALMKGKLSAFVGHSGVGKSSLLNALIGREVTAVGANSEGNKRGAHTTTAGTLWDLTESVGPGTQIIDTPGVRSFGLPTQVEEEVEMAFPEFDEVTCRFRDCTHTVEPGCGVLAAVAVGTISAYRYETYLKMRD
jgi:ribosome biogenesis GTPase